VGISCGFGGRQRGYLHDPLAALFDQFIKERIYLKNVTPKTIIWYQVAFKAYGRALPREAFAVPTKAGLQQFVIGLRERGLRPVTCNTYIGAMNAFCAWLHQEGHIGGPLKLKSSRPRSESWICSMRLR
jgi:hypothetical protein